MRACTWPACWLAWKMQCGGQERSFPSPAGPKRSSCPWPAKHIQERPLPFVSRGHCPFIAVRRWGSLNCQGVG